MFDSPMDWWLFGIVWSLEVVLVLGVYTALDRIRDRRS